MAVALCGLGLRGYSLSAAQAKKPATGTGALTTVCAIETRRFFEIVPNKTMQVSESHIQKLKFRGLVESWESRPSHLRLADLDPALLERARRGAGLIALTDEEYLVERKLADHRGRDLVLRQASELLFAKNGPDHPNAGFRLFRIVGTERKVGAEHNVEERPRFEGNLPTVIEECFSAIEGILRRPARLVGHRFRTVSEYPEFSWKEAIVNDAAHRDYNVEGRTTEIWFFDDRLEVVSPGGLLPDVNLEELLALHRIHVSRKPRTVRVLVDLGVVRDQGEGIPRMFAEMEGFFLPAPVLDPRDHLFRVTLRNTATLTADDKTFVARLGDAELTDVEFRALLEAHRAGRLDNARLRTIITVTPKKQWTHARHPYLSGDVSAVRIDASVLGLAPLALHLEDAPHDTAGRDGAGSGRPTYRLATPASDDPGTELLLEAQDCTDARDYAEADELLHEVLVLDVRHLDAHAMLGERNLSSWATLALHHFELGVAIGSLSVGEDFDGLLPWGLVENRPFLRCLHGLSRALLRCDRREDAAAALRRLLRLDPADPLGARARLAAIEAGKTGRKLETAP